MWPWCVVKSSRLRQITTSQVCKSLFSKYWFKSQAVWRFVSETAFIINIEISLFATECVVDCFKFVSSHALGFTVMALSSYDTKLRAAAYHVLGCFYHHLEGAHFREKRQVTLTWSSWSWIWLTSTSKDTHEFVLINQLLYLMDMVKNGIQKENLRLPFVMTTYIQKVAQLMLKPGVCSYTCPWLVPCDTSCEL